MIYGIMKDNFLREPYVIWSWHQVIIPEEDLYPPVNSGLAIWIRGGLENKNKK